MIYVDSNYRRQGIATKMFNRLRNEFPDYYIDWGYTLQDGEKLKNALTKEVVNKEYIELSNKIHKIDNELQKIEQNMDNAEWFDDSIQEERDLIGIKWEQLYDEKRELEDEIQDIRPYLTVWK
jgi:predicted  nucleic acid-binding Zn-ribbon protein